MLGTQEALEGLLTKRSEVHATPQGGGARPPGHEGLMEYFMQ